MITATTKIETITLDSLIDRLHSAPVAHDAELSESVGIDGNAATTWCVWNTVAVPGLIFFAQAGLVRHADGSAEINSNTGWDLITVEACDFDVIDSDGAPLDIIESIEYALRELDHDVLDFDADYYATAG